MDLKEVNAHKLTVTNVIQHLTKQLKENHGIELSAAKAKDVFIEAILRNIVLNEIADMMLFIVDEDKQFAEMEKRNQ